ncbi:MAG: respiratory nitrate reductase subunit gamma [Polyangiaceae bacterium]|nr:respiratory nitrate reductase subunit gamma [Polyangiaceae bacterium]
MIDLLLFGAFPYVAMVLFLVISIQRYRANAFTISSLSSQFLESGRLFWGSVPFHLGILSLFFGHLIGFLIPRQVMAWNESPLRLVVLEVTALASALLFLWGMVALISRRLSNRRLVAVTSWLDLVVYALLLFQALTGLYIALYLRWGSAWYVHAMVPYLRSIFTLQPEIGIMAGTPWAVRLHVLGAFTLITVFAFTRLMHVLVAPVPYIWRRVQLVLWNRDRKTIRTVEG